MSFLLASTVSISCLATFWATRLWDISLSDSRLHSHDLVVYVVLCSNQSLLYAFNDLLPLYLVFQVVLENKLAMAFTIELKVGDLFDIFLINDTKLTRHIVILALINIQYVGGLPVRRVPLLLLWHPHERCRLLLAPLLTCVLYSNTGFLRINAQLAGIVLIMICVVIFWEITRVLLVQFKVSQIELDTHELLRSLVQVQIDNPCISILRIVGYGKVQRHLLYLFVSLITD